MKNLVSAGLLMYKRYSDEIKVFLVHPGGPLFKNKGDGYWGIPKGLVGYGEDLLKAAIREFIEETGINPTDNLDDIGTVKLKSGKMVHAWTFEYFGDEEIKISSNTFKLEWPPHSGNIQFFPEIGQGLFLTLDSARKKINEAQQPFLDRLEEKLGMKKN